MKKIFTNTVPFILIFLILTGCNSSKTDKDVSMWNPVKRMQFPVDEKVNPYAIQIEVLTNTDGSQQIYLLDGNNQLLVYDADSQDLIKKVILDKEGNNGVGMANGFKLLSPDSILITSKFFQKLFLVNSKGSVISTYPFDSEHYTISRTCSNTLQPIIITDNFWVLPQSLLGNWNNIDKEYFEAYSTTINYNYKNGEVIKSGIKLPFYFSRLSSPNFSYNVFNNNLVYSFAASDSLFVIDNNMVLKYNTKTTNIKQLIEGNKSSSVESVLRDKIESGEYSLLLPDSFRNVIYRFYKIGTKLPKSDINLVEMNSFPPSFGIQVINQNYEVIADVTFPDNKYFFTNSFVTRDGLYISINHPLNPEFNVNYFAFDCFIFQK